MAYDFNAKLVWLGAQWTPDEGIFYTIRSGRIDWAKAEEFCRTVRSWGDDIPEGEPLPARFVAELWTIPRYIANFRPSLEAAGEPAERIDRFEADALDAVSAVLGLP